MLHNLTKKKEFKHEKNHKRYYMLNNRYVHLFILIFGFCYSNILAQDSTLISFKLKDQFKRKYTEAHFSDRIIILLEGDRVGSQYQNLWQEAIHDSLQRIGILDQTQIISAADLRGVPVFLKDFIRGKFPQERENWRLMDWNGILAKAYGFVSDKFNIIIFDRNHKVIHKVSVQELDIHELKKISTIFRKLKDNSL